MREGRAIETRQGEIRYPAEEENSLRRRVQTVQYPRIPPAYMHGSVREQLGGNWGSRRISSQRWFVVHDQGFYSEILKVVLE